MPVPSASRQGSRRGHPAAFVHGYSCSTAHWDGVRERLGGDVEVQLISLPGHDGTPLPQGVLDFEACVDHVSRSVAAMGRRGVCLVGHSLGGMIGLACVRQRPELFAGLVLVDAFPKLGQPHPFGKSFWAGSPARLKSRIIKEMMQTRRRLPSSLWESVVAFDGRPDLPLVGVPVYGMYGDRGEPDHEALRRVLLGTGLGSIPGLRLHVVPEAGHFVMLEQPRVFYELLAQILTELPGG